LISRRRCFTRSPQLVVQTSPHQRERWRRRPGRPHGGEAWSRPGHPRWGPGRSRRGKRGAGGIIPSRLGRPCGRERESRPSSPAGSGSMPGRTGRRRPRGLHLALAAPTRATPLRAQPPAHGRCTRPSRASAPRPCRGSCPPARTSGSATPRCPGRRRGTPLSARASSAPAPARAGPTGRCPPRSRRAPPPSAAATPPRPRGSALRPAPRALRELLELLGRVVFLEHRHCLDRLDELLGGDLLRRAQSLRDPFQSAAKELLSPDLFAQPCKVQLEHVQVRGAVAATPVQQLADLLQREPELAQREDLLEPRDLLLPVQPVAGAAARGRPQQPDPVVVVQGADGQPGPAGQLADLPVVPLHLWWTPCRARVRVATPE